MAYLRSVSDYDNPPAMGGEPAFPQKRGYARLVGALSKQKGWLESLTDEKRQSIVDKLVGAAASADSARDFASIARALAGLERNDIDRARLLMDVEQREAEQGSSDEARKLRADLDEIDRMEGGKPC